MTQRRIIFVIFDRFQALDLTGPHEVFQYATNLGGDFSCEVVATRAGPVESSSGMLLHATHSVAQLDPGNTDTLMVVGGKGVDQARHDEALVSWIAAAAAGARRVASVCSGVFLLAAAGLLDGRRVTTHWSRERQLAREHPEVRVDCDPIFIRDGRVWTSAGVTAGMDLALALVEDDLGRDVAHAVARELVLFLRRPGGQSQFSVALWSRQPSTDPMRAAVAAIHSDPGARHGIAELAAHAGLSPRHLQRRFTAELGVPPATYVEQVRFEAAQRALTEGDEPLGSIARRYGFTSAETLRRIFHRRLGVPPSDYRARFRSTGPLAGATAPASTEHPVRESLSEKERESA
ncbi:GlxA family transcriptional regulator [Streptomyces sp. CA-250714]|uniref:GlxA family transcriptional regulator n=1 Tax=Streptomyces sp. CA-250714 TaxID=3240060 RepID=UPI003D8CFE70